jgi:ubiquinone/menaquinone biosynthesis C-methylase UbiE
MVVPVSRAQTTATNLTLKDEIAAYWSARATSFDASPGHGIAPGGERDAWLTLIRDRLGELQGRRVLELASGTGELTRLLLDSGADVTGLDLSEAMLLRARQKIAKAGRRASLFLGDAEDTREPDGRYHGVVARHLVWTLPEPARAAADWFRVLQPGGRLLVIDGDWVRLPLPGLLRRAIGQALMRVLRSPSELLDWPAHERIMAQVHFRDGLQPGPLVAILREAGFVDVEIGSIAAIRRQQRRAAPFPRSLTVGVYEDFWLTAGKPAAGSVTTSSASASAAS